MKKTLSACAIALAAFSLPCCHKESSPCPEFCTRFGECLEFVYEGCDYYDLDICVWNSESQQDCEELCKLQNQDNDPEENQEHDCLMPCRDLDSCPEFADCYHACTGTDGSIP